MRKRYRWVLSLGLALIIFIVPLAVFAAETDSANTEGTPTHGITAIEAVTRLGVLKGDGDGVTDAYLEKTTTRLQAAILMLRLMGKEQEALGFDGTASFADAGKAGKASQPVLSFLKSHPEYGWSGTSSGTFEPTTAITAQQLYKVMLESLGYRTGTDFAYADTLKFAETKGLFRAANALPFTNRDLAIVLVETLKSMPKGAEHTLLHKLIEDQYISNEHAILLDHVVEGIHQTDDISYTIALGTDVRLGKFLVDSSGVSLYYFDKDPKNSSVCRGDCLVKWPVFHVDEILVPTGLNKGDFGEITRADGSKQTTFKDYPLYYYVEDEKAGDVKGQNLGEVWFVVNPATFTGTTVGQPTPAPVDPAPVTDKVTVEMIEFSFTPTKLTVKAGTTIEFINKDDMKHNAVAVDGSFETKLLAKGEFETIKLDKPGTYEYFCEPHKSFMKGTIIVE